MRGRALAAMRRHADNDAMGINLVSLDWLREMGALQPATRVLDIGSSNLYSAPPRALAAFASKFGVTLDEQAIVALSEGSAYGPGRTRNKSFVGDLLTLLGVDYTSIDIADGCRTVLLDLNTQRLPDSMCGSFDLVLNFGTTEHIINQLNAFTAIHDACKVGGQIVHALPSSGWMDHGYFKYTPRFFFDLCAYNNYEMVWFGYSKGPRQTSVWKIINDYRRAFPALQSVEQTEEEVPIDLSSRIIMRKVKDGPFKNPLETSTSVGIVHRNLGPAAS
jgi:SAM-dependent methyltransferase